MTKEDYREKVEEHRQEIDLHNESGTKMSRVSRHRKKSGKKQTNPIMTVLTVVLIFIPLVILAYVWLIYEPNTSASENVNADKKDDLVVEIQKQDPKTHSSATNDDEEKKDDNTAEVDEAKVKAEKEKLAAEEAKKAEARIAKEKAAKEAEEIKKAEEAQKVAAAKAKEQEAKKKAAQEAAKSQQKTHTVQSTDNLYRIALKYYGNGSAEYVNKIKAANNLSSDSIATGQVLVIVP
ncbi:Elastin-binding protein ebpS [Solibacillus isronensis B3W22]|uniref:Elastin-binding protein ebpS n=1 Tax=Solibacillus isronensis B3W22 TaxID=1224748 RepID=K1LPA2_9BACL|nr:LysM peptidoglycan-binding domain-containing protein [Solibacillus isronensis]AMO84945.1 Elastin-binding protein ebpS [Solibacillus silvestris]EKB46004.1 Elastin-binding protein ebpS [Solibacillus isronensis B3W22]